MIIDPNAEHGDQDDSTEKKTSRLNRSSIKEPLVVSYVKTGHVIGRNKAIVDPEDVRRLAELHVPVSDMARFFGVEENTLTYNFKEIIVMSREITKQRLREKQIEVAMSGSIPMLIWLGKNMLAQQETPEPVVDEDSRNIEITVTRPKKPAEAKE